MKRALNAPIAVLFAASAQRDAVTVSCRAALVYSRRSTAARLLLMLDAVLEWAVNITVFCTRCSLYSR